MPRRFALRPRFRRLSQRGVGAGSLAQLLPKAIILPILILAGITASAAGYWTYDMHIEQAAGDVEEIGASDTVDSAE